MVLVECITGVHQKGEGVLSPGSKVPDRRGFPVLLQQTENLESELFVYRIVVKVIINVRVGLGSPLYIWGGVLPPDGYSVPPYSYIRSPR